MECVITTPETSSSDAPARVSPDRNACHASSVFHPRSTTTRPLAASTRYENTYFNGLGKGRAETHTPGITGAPRRSSSDGAHIPSTGRLAGMLLLLLRTNARRWACPLFDLVGHGGVVLDRRGAGLRVDPSE